MHGTICPLQHLPLQPSGRSIGQFSLGGLFTGRFVAAWTTSPHPLGATSKAKSHPSSARQGRRAALRPDSSLAARERLCGGSNMAGTLRLTLAEYAT